MAESQFICEVQRCSTDPDMDAARGVFEEKSDNNDIEEGDQNQGDISDITSRILQEIFGKDPEVVRPRKRRFQSIAYIYLMTKPLNVVHSKKMRMRC
uniref:Uncharacterized protein n=1 Tax=Nelumbo nucifera TaxID=4432 RepID=A0A822XR61_NELNU|nr:TPA_asm: hypothetical protein HUJ06_023975 [Nelumbo nucifera]